MSPGIIFFLHDGFFEFRSGDLLLFLDAARKHVLKFVQTQTSLLTSGRAWANQCGNEDPRAQRSHKHNVKKKSNMWRSLYYSADHAFKKKKKRIFFTMVSVFWYYCWTVNGQKSSKHRSDKFWPNSQAPRAQKLKGAAIGILSARNWHVSSMVKHEIGEWTGENCLKIYIHFWSWRFWRLCDHFQN